MRKILCFLICMTTMCMPVKYFVCADAALPEISAPSALLMDFETGEIMYEKNPDEKRPLASVTKIMTLLLAMEEIENGTFGYDDIVTGSEHARSYGGSTIFLDAGEQMSVSDILKGIAVASGNDAAVAIGEHISGSEDAFVVKMNERATQLGMTNTNFVNCNGLDAENHYSTARDIALMSRELMKHEDVFKYTTIWMDSLRNGAFTLSNTNKLIKFYDGATGLKTGSTSKAGFCISATAKRDNMHLIAVIMGAETSKKRQADASTLLNYGFSTYALENISHSGDKVGKVRVTKGKSDYVDAKIIQDCNYLYKKGNNDKYETEIKLKKQIQAPVKSGMDVGYVSVKLNGKEINKLPVVSDRNVASENFYGTFSDFISQWFSLDWM